MLRPYDAELPVKYTEVSLGRFHGITVLRDDLLLSWTI